MLKIGQIAPLFALADRTGALHELQQYRDKWVLLYFYPKDNTPGCTTEACAVRDNWGAFTTKNAVVLGVSADSQKSHQKFVSQHQLPFPVLSDPEKTVITEYGALIEKSMFGKKYLGINRISYLINPTGLIAKLYQKVEPSTHIDEVLKDLDAAQSNL